MGLRTDVQAMATDWCQGDPASTNLSIGMMAVCGQGLQRALDNNAQVAVLTPDEIQRLEDDALKGIENSSMVRISPRQLAILLHLAKECTS